MGIFDALNTSVSGLQAQSFALQNISGNIANASTVGYKGTNTSFEDLVPNSTTPDQQPAGGVRAHAQATITTRERCPRPASAPIWRSAVQASSTCKPAGVVDNVPVFSGVQLHAPRRFPAQCQRQSRQRCRILPAGRDRRPQDRKSDWKRAAGSAVSEQFHSGAGDDQDHLCPPTSRPGRRRLRAAPPPSAR